MNCFELTVGVLVVHLYKISLEIVLFHKNYNVVVALFMTFYLFFYMHGLPKRICTLFYGSFLNF